MSEKTSAAANANAVNIAWQTASKTAFDDAPGAESVYQNSLSVGVILDQVEADSFVDDDELVMLQTLADTTDVDAPTRARLNERLNQRLTGIGAVPSPMTAAFQRRSTPTLATKREAQQVIFGKTPVTKQHGFLRAGATASAESVPSAARSQLSDNAATVRAVALSPVYPGPNLSLVTDYLNAFGPGQALRNDQVAASAAFQAWLEENASRPEVVADVRDRIMATPFIAMNLSPATPNLSTLWGAAVTRTPYLKADIPSSLWSDPAFLEEIQGLNARDLLEELPVEASLDPEVIAAAQPEFRAKYSLAIAQQAQALRRAHPEEYASFVDGLKKTDIHSTWRFNDLDALRRLVAVRLQPPSTLVPEVLFIDDTSDYSGGLDEEAEKTFANIKSSHNLRYYNGKEVEADLRQALEEHRAAGVLVRKLVISGHGSKYTTGNLFRSTLAQILRQYADVIAPNADITLLGRSNGSGGEGADNMVNAAADAVPQANVRGAMNAYNLAPLDVEDDKLVGGFESSEPIYERKATGQ